MQSINYIKSNLHDAVQRLTSSVVALAIVLSLLVPLLISGRAQAGNVSNRSITVTSSVLNTSTTYAVSFQPANTTAIAGIVVDFCVDSPLIGAACSKTNGVTAVPTSGTVTALQTGGTPASVVFNAVVGTTAQAGRLMLTHATGFTAPITTAPITFSFTATNPNTATPGTFYARIITYNTGAQALPYDSGTANANNPGTHIDDGGIALSTARQLLVQARVQEELEFCVGVTDSTVISNGTAPANCAAAAFAGAAPTVDLGVVSSTISKASPVTSATGGNNNNGAVMIRTNASIGASVTYFAEQNAASGRLKVASATCNTTGGASTLDAGSGNQDQCFNSNSSQANAGNNFQTTNAGEKFGMTAGKVLRPTGSTTTNLVRATDYDGDGTITAGVCAPGTVDSVSCFAWDSSGTTTTIASSTTVLDYEMLVLNFAARAAATTPTGFYSVTSTYVGTGTF